MQNQKASRKLLERLPVYLNYLKSLPEQTGNVSATSIALALGLGHVQVRKDLAKVSDEGRRRTGRSREKLIRDIEDYLHYATTTGTILVGAGKLGRALLDYDGFEELGLNVMAGFDRNPVDKQTEQGKPIYPMGRLESFCRCYDVRIGIIALPAESAQEVCDMLVSCGVKAIWNFAPVCLHVPEHVVVQSENLAVSFASLCMLLKEKREIA